MSNDSQQVLRGLVKWGIAAILCAPFAATGQVRPIQDGQALDANPRIGSHGSNIRAPAGSRFDSQLYVTGQVSGLRRFRGTVGYFGENELHLSLPSASLGDFRRKSVGLQDVLQGYTYEPTPYYERTATMVKADGILGGRAVPGTSVPAAAIPAATPLGQKLYVDALADFYSVEALRPGRALAPPTPTSLIPSLAPSAAPGTTAAAAGAPLSPLRAPQATSLFAVARSTERADLVQELHLEARRKQLVDRRIEAKVEAAADRAPPGRETTPAAETKTDATAPADQDQTRGGLPGISPGEPAPDQDAFMDLMMLQMRQRQRKRAATTTAATMAATASVPAAVAPRPTRTGSLVKLDKGGQIVIHDLVGRSKDLFNMRMAEAAEKLRQKRYYDAVSLYEAAGRTTPRNPLARVGMGLSLLGAGESLSAAHQFSRAISLFPPMTESRIDLAALIDAKVIDAELAKIEDRLRRANDETKRMLQFLAMFLYHNSRQEAKAKSLAEEVRSSSDKTALFGAYADFILRSRAANEDDEAEGSGKTPAKSRTDDLRP